MMDRIVELRRVYALTKHRIPNKLKFSPLEAAKFCEWLNSLGENDPFLGFSPFGKQIFGMTIEESHDVEGIVVCHE